MAEEAITDKEIETLAAKAEGGYDVDTLLASRSKRGRPALDSAPASVVRAEWIPSGATSSSSAPRPTARRPPRSFVKC